MRPAALVGLALAALPTPAAAQPSHRAVVDVDEAVVRAGPSDRFDQTGTLPRGTKLRVDHEDQNGWLAVAHAPASVSWVVAVRVKFDADEVRPFPRQAVAEVDTEVAAGRVGHGRPLDIRRAKVPAGTILTVIGQKVTGPDGMSWYPVLPPDEDYRYVPKSAVRFDKPANTSYVVKAEAPPGLPPVAGVAPAAGRVTPADPATALPAKAAPLANHPLWATAEAADRANRYDEAEGLYFQIARESTGPDHDTANLCYSRIHTLRERKRNGGAVPTGGVAAGGGRESPDSLPASGGSRPPPATTLGRPEPTRPAAGLLPPVRADRGDRAEPATPAADRGGWTAGRLRSSPLVIDNQTTYALEASPGVVKAYVLPARGVDLKPFLNQRVELYGTTQPRRGDVTKPVLDATDVRDGR